MKWQKNIILANFKPTGRQSVRCCLDIAFISELRSLFQIDSEIDGGLFDENHYKRLCRSRLCAAYCGEFIQDLNQTIHKDNPLLAQLLKNTVISRWDNWRFWESLTCGCPTIHLDLEKYGCKLPISPINWKHYIGLNLSDLKNDIHKIMHLHISGELEKIGQNGKNWVLEHYTPVAVAKRFLKMLNLSYLTEH